MQWKCLNVGMVVGAIAALSHPALAQVVEDNTLGAENSQVIRNVQIHGVDSDRIEGGARRGQNLFHSFQQFSIQEGRGAYFLNPDGVRNIFSRVTGGGRSDIFGRLGVIGPDNATLGTANLFLINPNGIVFGANSSLDVGGSFVGTTANGLQFGDRGFFDATNPEAPSDLLTIAPSAFLFSQVTARAGIINQSIFGLNVPIGQSLLLVGGDVALDGGNLFAPGGRIEIGGLSQAGAIGLGANTLQLSFPANIGRSDVTLTNGSLVSTVAGGNGAIAITGRNVTIGEGSRTLTGLTGTVLPNSQAGDVAINATGNITLADSSFIASLLSGGAGNSGNVSVTGQNVNLRNQAGIITASNGQGNAGTVAVAASNTLQLETGSGIFSSVSSLQSSTGIGKGGDVQINAQDIFLNGGSFISTSNLSAQGEPGNLQVVARDALRLSQSARISTDTSGAARAGTLTVSAQQLTLETGGALTTSTSSSGRGGDLTVNADTIALTGGTTDGQFSSSISSESAANTTGAAGNVTVSTRQLNIQDGATISTSTRGAGSGGRLNVTARESTDLSGTITNSVTGASSGSGLFSTALGSGNADSLTFNTGRLTVRNGATVSTSTFGSGRGGDLTVNADTIALIGGTADGQFVSQIGSESAANTTGAAGNVTVSTRQLNIQDGATISSSTRGAGQGGRLNVTARESTDLSGIITNSVTGLVSSSGLFSATLGSGNADSLTFSTGRLRVQNGAVINASTFGIGRAGDVNVTADTIDLIGRTPNGQAPSGLGSESNVGATGEAGNVIVSTRLLNIRDGALLSATTYGQGKGGNLNVTVRDLTDLSGSGTATTGQVFSSGIFATTGGAQNAGTLTLNTRRLNIRDGAQVNASTFGTGRAGDVTVTADTIDLIGRTANGQAPSGIGSESNVGATGRAGDVTISTRLLTIREGATLSTATFGQGKGGDLNVIVDDLTDLSGSGTATTGQVFSSGIFATTQGAQNAGTLTLTTGLLNIRNGGQVTASTFSAGRAGDVNVTADSIDLSGFSVDRSSFSQISSQANPGAIGAAGNVSVSSRLLDIRNGAVISTSTFGQGRGGSLEVTVRESARLAGSTQTASGQLTSSGLFTSTSGSGAAGNLTFRVGQLSMRDGAIVNASTYGRGRGGNVQVTVRDTTEITGFGRLANGQVGSSSGLFTVTQGAGRAGNLRLETGQLNVDRQGAISASTSSGGNAGNVTVTAHDSIALNRGNISSSVIPGATGNAGNITVETQSLSARNGGQVIAGVLRQQFREGTLVAGGQGNGGNIYISAPDFITLSGIESNGFSSGILALSERGASGRAGNIRIDTGELRVADGAIVTAATFNPGGRGGDINIDARNLEVLGGGQILTNTRSSRNAGSIRLNIADTLTLSGRNTTFDERRANVNQRLELNNPVGDRPRDVIVNEGDASGLFANTDRSTGNGGQITVNTNTLNLRDGASISAQSRGIGRAGNISLNASGQLNATDSAIATRALNSSGGNISINEGTEFGVVVLQDSDIITNSKGNGGNINVRGAGTVAFGDSDILAGSIQESGGDITLGRYFGQGQTNLPTTPLFENDGQPDVNAEGDRTSGDVRTTDTSFIQNSLNELSVDAINTATLLANSCIVRDRQRSSFTVTGADNFPQRPGHANSSAYPTGTIRSIPSQPSTTRPWQIGDPIVEPQGVYRLPDGRLVMSRECSE